MKHIDPKTLDVAFLPLDTPMFSDVIRHIETNPELFSTRDRDLVSGLRRVAQAIGRSPDNVPADARWLQTRLTKVVPAAIGVSPKTWSNIVSNANAALARFGVVDRRINRISDLSPEWLHLWKLALASGVWTLRTSLGRFVYFLNRAGIAPEEVRDSHARDFREAIAASAIRKDPDLTYRYAVNAWNQAARIIPEWPRAMLTVPKKQVLIKLPAGELPPSLHVDLDRLVETLKRPDRFEEHGRPNPLRPTTIRQYRNQLLRFAAEVVRSGVPPETLVDVAALCSPKTVERGLRQMLARNNDQMFRSLSETAALLRNLAKSYCAFSDADVKAIARLAGRVAPKAQTGMTSKNRSRLRVLQDPANQRKLLTLSERLFDSTKRRKKPYAGALDREAALAIAILRVCPIRVKNLAGIHLERHLQRPGDGRVFLSFESDEVKNEVPLEFELPQDVVKLIERHVATRAPTLCPRSCLWLFPLRDGSGPSREGDLASRVTKCIRSETGLEVNVHLFRHLAAMIWLDANPGSYETVRRLLGHSDLSHTLNLYTGLEGRAATRAFADLIATKKEQR